MLKAKEKLPIKKIVRHIESQQYNDWFILSAKYGILNKSEIIEPYELTLNTMSSSEVKQWSSDVFIRLTKHKIQAVDFYAGERYRKYLIPMLENKRIKYNIPLLGLGIGEQLRYLNLKAGE